MSVEGEIPYVFAAVAKIEPQAYKLSYTVDAFHCDCLKFL